MCGIAGYISDEDVVDPRLNVALALLGVFMTERGKQSWGWSDGTNIFKQMGEFRAGFGGNLIGTKKALVHTRHATFGEKIKENSHPFAIGNIIGAHNGIVYNHKDIADKHGYEYKVDSEIIFQHINAERDLSELDGYGAVAFWQEGVFNIGRFNKGEMALAKTDFGWMFASTEIALADAVGMAGLQDTVRYQPKLKEGTLYQLIGDRIVKSKTTKLNIGRSASNTKTWDSGYDYSSRYNYQGYKGTSIPAITSATTPTHTVHKQSGYEDSIVYGSPEWYKRQPHLAPKQLPLPTAETTTFMPVDESPSGLAALNAAIESEMRSHDAQWEAYMLSDAYPCDWCSSPVIGQGNQWRADILCSDCYDSLTAEDVEDMIAEDEEAAYEAQMEVEGEAFERELRREKQPIIVSNDFDHVAASFVSKQSEVECDECQDASYDNVKVYVHRVFDYKICGDCHHRIYPATAHIPTTLNQVLAATIH